jgi:CBS-domain-containing membrane protein
MRLAKLQVYLSKMKGGGNNSPHPIHWRNALCSWMGGFLGIALVGWMDSLTSLTTQDHLLLIGSFGATAVLLYGSPSAPFAQPRYVVGGHVICALVGVTFYKLMPEPLWFSSALTVSTAIVLMYLTRTTHPPGGGTALIAVAGSERVHELGYWFVFEPILLGVSLLLFVALVINNLSPLRRYPHYWF